MEASYPILGISLIYIQSKAIQSFVPAVDVFSMVIRVTLLRFAIL